MRGFADIEEGRHSSWRLPLVALLLAAPVCMAQQAVVPEKSPPPTPASTTAPAAAPPINLYLKEASQLLPQAQWDQLVASQVDEAAESGDLPSIAPQVDVEVEAKKKAPKVPGGIAGLFWALRHPTQAWRVLTPAPTE